MGIIYILSRINFKKIFFLCLLYVLMMTAPSGSFANMVPESFLKWPERGPGYGIIVDKYLQKVFLFSKKDITKPVREYKCSSGENKGRKAKVNDKKTPEGIYFFTNAFNKKDLAPIYGEKAFTLDYPNPLDEKEGRSGYGIWFHGLNKPLKPRDTSGCIAFENKDILELASFVSIDETPVVITEKVNWVPREKLVMESDMIRDVIETWKNSWQDKDIQKYIGLYHPQFSSQGMNLSQWKTYKSQLAGKYKKIDLQIEDLQLYKTNGSVLAVFIQYYKAPHIESYGRKKLYLKKVEGQWKIASELFHEDRSLKKIFAEKSVDSSKELVAVVGQWKKVWESGDIVSYIDYYDRDFQSQGMDYGAWKTYKSQLKDKYHTVKIQIDNIKVIALTDTKAEVSFSQKYYADGYSDYGSKILFFVKNDNQWKIKKEIWSEIKK